MCPPGLGVAHPTQPEPGLSLPQAQPAGHVASLGLGLLRVDGRVPAVAPLPLDFTAVGPSGWPPPPTSGPETTSLG